MKLNERGLAYSPEFLHLRDTEWDLKGPLTPVIASDWQVEDGI